MLLSLPQLQFVSGEQSARINGRPLSGSAEADRLDRGTRTIGGRKVQYGIKVMVNLLELSASYL